MNLRVFLFLCLSGVAVLPVFALGGWIFTQALDREIDSVTDKHLVIARNVGEALDRYAIDLRNGFTLVSTLTPEAARSPNVFRFLRELNFVHFCFADLETGAVVREVAPRDLPCPEIVPPPRFSLFKGLAQADEVVFSPVMKNPAGEVVFYLLKARAGILTIGAVRTTYIVEQGRTVSFGELGHAAIVDSTGRVIAHPLESWEQEHKDISKVDPVRRMLAGETGTAQFYSPALKADMVTGFTPVPTPGWGIMVPQPLAELRVQAETVQLSALLIGGLGLVAAAALSWFLSGSLARALTVVADASHRMARGDYDARAQLGNGWKPREIKEVADTFNRMADEISSSNRSLKQALEEADSAARAKSEFLAVTSHELRTPLNAILGFSEVMTGALHGPLDKKYAECAADIHAAGGHLKALIDDILLISKTGSDRELENEIVGMADLFRSMAKIHQSVAEEKAIDLRIAPPDPDILIKGDERLLRQMLINLVGNAVKFTGERGAVDLSAAAGAEGVLITVTDTGPGIAPEDLESIWTPFHQVGDPMVRSHDGFGLGLSIVQTIVAAHDGAVSVQSEPGVGSTFAVRIPANRIVIPGETLS